MTVVVPWVAAILVRWLVLLTSGLAMVLPNGIAEACDPSQCIDEAVHSTQAAQEVDPLTRGESDESQTKHDCDGPFHVCHCCVHAQGVSQRLSLRIAAPRSNPASPAAFASDRALTGYRVPLYRPPSA
jgi:hypothetical protein